MPATGLNCRQDRADVQAVGQTWVSGPPPGGIEADSAGSPTRLGSRAPTVGPDRRDQPGAPLHRPPGGPTLPNPSLAALGSPRGPRSGAMPRGYGRSTREGCARPHGCPGTAAGSGYRRESAPTSRNRQSDMIIAPLPDDRISVWRGAQRPPPVQSPRRVEPGRARATSIGPSPGRTSGLTGRPAYELSPGPPGEPIHASSAPPAEGGPGC
jgi:hypothetical protein